MTADDLAIVTSSAVINRRYRKREMGIYTSVPELSDRVAYNISMDDIVIRRATESDLPTLGRLGALLMQTHYAFDQQRFMVPGANAAAGYARFLRSQLTQQDVIVFVAE